MTFIQRRDGQFFLKDGQLATGEPCCCVQPPCGSCENGSLPDVIAITLDNLPSVNDADQATCCGDFYNGKTYYLTRNHPSSDGTPECKFRHEFCGVGNRALNKGFLEVVYSGPGVSPTVALRSEIATPGPINRSTMCDTDFTTETTLDCDEPFEFEATAENGATATVRPLQGDEQYDPNAGYSGDGSCHICCQGSEPIAEEVEATITWRYEEDGVGVYEIELDVTLLLDDVAEWMSNQNTTSPSWSLLAEQASEDPSPYWLAIAPQILAAQTAYMQATGNSLLYSGAFCGIPDIGTPPSPWTFDADQVGVDGLLAWPIPGFSVNINTCDLQDGDHWSGSLPAQFSDCADCFKSCWTNFTLLKPSGTDPAYSSLGCDQCKPTPMCRPSPGIYTSDCVTPLLPDPNLDLPGTSSLTIEIHGP